MAKEGKFAVFNDDGYLYKREAMARVLTPLLHIVKTHAELIQGRIQASMREPKTGNKYWRPGGRIHIASAPGEAPAVDTGKLIKSTDRIRYSNGGLVAEIGSFGVPYAGFLEYGTRKMAKRPYVAPAAEKYAEQFRQLIAMSIARI